MIYFNTYSAATDVEKAKLLNSYFKFVFTSSSFELSPIQEIFTPTTAMSNTTLTEESIHDELILLDPNKAMEV